MKFNSVGAVEQVVWTMRVADLPRGENRAILNRLYNGEPPFDPAKAEENTVQINRNFLHGPNLMTQGRTQWNRAFMGQAKYFNVRLDSGPIYKRQEWSTSITTNINRQLKRSRTMMEQTRAEGANVLLHGIAPSCFKDRRNPIPTPLMVSSLMIPSETDIDFENLEYFAVFREWTCTQFYDMTHGPKVDPGWNMDAVNQVWNYVKAQVQKQPNSNAYQYMPERIEELVKQDMGFWGSDAAPTVDIWDFYFRDTDSDCWYRRIFLDWDVTGGITEKSAKPDSRNNSKQMGGFLYTSGNRKFAGKLGEILQCQFGDCSAVAPFKYHSVRSLGWMLWGVCDLMNRYLCRFTESSFEQLMWFFRTASESEFQRVKKAMFTHMGVIPNGISFVTAQDRFKPDAAMSEIAMNTMRQIMSENAAAFTQDFKAGQKDMTATEVMARSQSVNQLVSGMLTLAYEYSKYKYTEQARRFCIKTNPYQMVRDFRVSCLKDGVPPEMLDSNRWDIEPDRAIGDGNKVLEMGIVQFLQGIRKNLGPDAQRKVDHISIVSATDRPALAEDLAPIQGQKKLSPSVHDAELASDRILRGLKFTPSPEMVPEDYVATWLGDMSTVIQQIQQSGQVGTMEKIQGLVNMNSHITAFLKEMESNPDDVPKVKAYSDVLGKMMNLVKGFAQRLAQQQGQNGNGGDPETAAKLKGKLMLDAVKAKNMSESHAMRTAQKQAQFEMDQQRQDRQTAADIRRKNAVTASEVMQNRLKSLTE